MPEMLETEPRTPRNIVIEQGTTFNLVVNVQDSVGAIRDLTGYTGEAEVRKDSDSATIVQVITVTFTDALNGEITLQISAADTLALDFGNDVHVYDLLITPDAGTTVEKIVEGTATLKKNITEL